MGIDQIAAEALRLPPEQRAILAESLWESLSDPFRLTSEYTDAEALALAIKRDCELESGEVPPDYHDEMMSRRRG